MDRKFVIVSDSSCSLSNELRKQYNIEYIPMYFSYDETSLPADLDWKELSAKGFYDILRNDTRIFTSQVPAQDYLNRFEEYIKNGYDVLSISCSSGLSASVKASGVVRDELLTKYPEAKIICIDSLICSFGLGMLCMYASDLRAQGKTITEVAELVEGIKMNVNQLCTVGELKYLKRAGRISATTALFGTMLNIKPIIVSNTRGENASVEKVKGRVKSLRRLAELTKEKFTGETISGIYICHADCIEDAEKLKDFILEVLPGTQITIGILDPIVGASAGPDTLGIYFVGTDKPNTDNA